MKFALISLMLAFNVVMHSCVVLQNVKQLRVTSNIESDGAIQNKGETREIEKASENNDSDDSEKEEQTKEMTGKRTGSGGKTLKDATDDAMNVPNQEQRPGGYSTQEFNHLRQSFISFSKLLAHITFFQHGAPASNVVGSFATIIFDAYNRAQGGRKLSIWDQIKQKVETEVQQAITEEHFDNLKTEFSDLPRRMRKGPRFDEDDLGEIMKLKHEVFPQDERADYSPHWAPTIICWLMHVVAGYMEMRKDKANVENCDTKMDNNCIGRCGLADEMKVIRHDIIQAIQALYQKRYAKIRGIKSNTGFSNAASLQFRDGISGKVYPSADEWSSSFTLSRTKNTLTIKRSFLDKLLQDVYRTAEQIREHYNSHVTNLEPILMNCQNKPEPIPRFYTNVYNPRFYGSIATTAKGESPCLLPCDGYGEGYDWCPNDYIIIPYKKGVKSERGKLFPAGGNWATCSRPDFNEVIPTERTSGAWFVLKEVEPYLESSESEFRAPPEAYTHNPPTTLQFPDDYVGEDGEWGEWDECGGNSHVISFRMKNDFNDNDDNSGINSIQMMCRNGKIVQSSVGPHGSYGNWSPLCQFGYDEASEVDKNNYGNGDKLGIIDVKLRCKETMTRHSVDQSMKKKFLHHVGWTPIQRCGNNQRICGLKTKVQGSQILGIGDATGLNDAQFKCCSLKPEAYFI